MMFFRIFPGRRPRLPGPAAPRRRSGRL